MTEYLPRRELSVSERINEFLGENTDSWKSELYKKYAKSMFSPAAEQVDPFVEAELAEKTDPISPQRQAKEPAWRNAALTGRNALPPWVITSQESQSQT